MSIGEAARVIGLTGPFGSGCTTASELLSQREGYRIVRPSDFLREEWDRRNGKEAPVRSDLQKLGNELREQAKRPGILVENALATVELEDATVDRVIVDGIRNLGEIEALRTRFAPNFYLFAIECPQSERWERVKDTEYGPRGLRQEEFNLDNHEDKDQETPYGQQVQLCVDAADVLIVNDADVALATLRTRLDEYSKLVFGDVTRYARPDEILMNLAYSASHGSKCLKRQVGAVLVAAKPGDMGDVVGIGFNENPVGTSPCVEEKQYGANAKAGTRGKCFRDIVRYRSFLELAKQGRKCPACGDDIREPANESPPWRCANQTCRRNLEDFFWKERAMSFCTAVHAEVQAILAARGRSRGSTLYTSTLPCFQCAQKVVQAGVEFVVYTEPYPDVHASERLDMAGVRVGRFEGIRSRRFDEIFARARPYFSA